MQNKINVDMGDYKISENGKILQTIGLGSCVGICLYDKIKKIGGLAHIMAANSYENINPKRFADKAIEMMLDEMIKKGCNKTFMTAKIAGGANMFPELLRMTIGDDNVFAIKEKLKKLNIPLIAEETGGIQGRSIWFDTVDGSLVVSKVHGETKSY